MALRPAKGHYAEALTPKLKEDEDAMKEPLTNSDVKGGVARTSTASTGRGENAATQ